MFHKVGRNLGTSLLSLVVIVMSPSVAAASHLSGGENDLMGLYGGTALVLGFAGLLGGLGLLPARVRSTGRQWGGALLGAGLCVLVGGGVHVAWLGRPEDRLGDLAFGQMATRQLLGTLAVFSFFGGAALLLGKRSGVLDMGEAVKYRLLHNGDPADLTSARTALPGEERIMLIPLAAMGLLAIFFLVGVLLALGRLSRSV